MATSTRAPRTAETAQSGNGTDTQRKPREVKDVNTLPPDERVTLSIGLPAGLRVLIEQEAENKKVLAGTLVKEWLAERFGYKLPPSQRGARKKYASEAEREAALQEARDKKAALMRLVMKKMEAGEIEVDEEEIKRTMAEIEAKRQEREANKVEDDAEAVATA